MSSLAACMREWHGSEVENMRKLTMRSWMTKNLVAVTIAWGLIGASVAQAYSYSPYPQQGYQQPFYGTRTVTHTTTYTPVYGYPAYGGGYGGYGGGYGYGGGAYGGYTGSCWYGYCPQPYPYYGYGYPRSSSGFFSLNIGGIGLAFGGSRYY